VRQFDRHFARNICSVHAPKLIFNYRDVALLQSCCECNLRCRARHLWPRCLALLADAVRECVSAFSFYVLACACDVAACDVAGRYVDDSALPAVSRHMAHRHANAVNCVYWLRAGVVPALRLEVSPRRVLLTSSCLEARRCALCMALEREMSAPHFYVARRSWR
jgi:hypothetical protein